MLSYKNHSSISDKAIDHLINHSFSKIDIIGHYFCHFAMIYTCKGKSLKVYSYGFNQVRKGRSIHAEVDAINNLPPIAKKKKLVKVNLLVIRMTRSGFKLAESKCCVKCCESIYKIPPYRGYTIDNVAYSREGNIVEDDHPINLLLDDNYHISVYYSNRNYKPKIRDKIISCPDRRTQLFIKKKADNDSETE